MIFRRGGQQSESQHDEDSATLLEGRKREKKPGGKTVGITPRRALTRGARAGERTLVGREGAKHFTQQRQGESIIQTGKKDVGWGKKGVREKRGRRKDKRGRGTSLKGRLGWKSPSDPRSVPSTVKKSTGRGARKPDGRRGRRQPSEGINAKQITSRQNHGGKQRQKSRQRGNGIERGE